VTNAADVVVVGGGIVGLATANALAELGARAIVLEAESTLATHQTGHNSGVIHSGLYYKPGSLKARTCAAGREELYAFCAESGVPARRCGKLVVATDETQIPRLAMLEERGRANGLQGLTRLDQAAIRQVDPEVAGVAGLWVTETGVVDFRAVTRALAARLERRGGAVRTGTRVVTITGTAGEVSVVTAPHGERFAARLLVNCAGLQSDRVARLAGVDPGIAIIPFRGDYYTLRPERASLVRNLVYPVPDPDLPFLGVHFTRRIDGRVEAGPNALLALHRERYSRWALSPRDAGAVLTFPGFWRMARRFWSIGVSELGRSWSKALFVRALQRLVPAVRAADLQQGGCGIRAQAVDSSGRLLDDFHIVESETGVHLVNAPSPAATASLSIGRQLAGRVLERLDGSVTYLRHSAADGTAVRQP
jgi:L-2-hydroxyglutarate oxidase